MNDDQQQPFLDKPAAAPPANAAESAGAMLRQAREAAGVHLAALAVSLKVQPARLEALEAGRIDLLPDPVFARALAASICRTLKLDPEPVLRQLPRTASPAAAAARASADAGGRPVQAPAAGAARAAGRSGLWARPFMGAAVLLVLAALALVLLPDLNWDRFAGGNAPAVPAARPGAPRSGEAIDRPAVAASGPAASATPSQPQPQPPAAAPVQATAPAAAAAPSEAGTAEAAPAVPAEKTSAAPVQAPAGDTIVFRTQSEAWISVIDANGTPLLRKNVAAGQTVGVSGTLPLRVTVGRADVTRVSVRGEPFDLAPVTRGSVARFEIK